MNKRPRVVLKKGREHSVLNRHPWVFSGAVSSCGGAQEGDAVDIFSSSGAFLAVGHYSSGSIALRIFSFEPVADDVSFFKDALEKAIFLRRRLQLEPQTNAYRLFNAEGDGIPGLVIDLYGEVAVLQCHSAGMKRSQAIMVELLCELLKDKIRVIISRSREGEGKTEEEKSSCLFGQLKQEIEIKENSLSFYVDCFQGQKTGFFLDQRDNRLLTQRYCKNRSVLNAFSYTGGFSVYALAGGAKDVCSVDISAVALEVLKRNIERNFPGAYTTEACADCLHYLQNLNQSYDCIILDPPAFVKHRGALKGGLKGYESINYQAFRQIKPGGIIFTFSCSAHIDRLLFRQTLAKAAARAQRKIRVLHELSQAACHPVSIFHPEGEYLKGLVIYVE